SGTDPGNQKHRLDPGPTGQIRTEGTGTLGTGPKGTDLLGPRSRVTDSKSLGS
ncbi:hypothetical protein AVEN_18503-1, partial [Araneus ventricosus]